MEILSLVVLLGCIISVCAILDSASKDKSPKYKGDKVICPRCGSLEYHIHVEEQVVIPEKVKSRTTLNLNPLKPFTIYNHEEKIVQRTVTRKVSKFVCDKCGKIFG